MTDTYEEEDDATEWLHELEACLWGDFSDEGYVEALDNALA